MPEWPPDWDERKRGKDCPMCASGRQVADGAYSRFPEDELRGDAASLQARLAG